MNMIVCVVNQHVYIPLLFFSGVDYIDAPTPYMMGLHSGVDTTGLSMDGVSLSGGILVIFYEVEEEDYDSVPLRGSVKMCGCKGIR